MNKGIAELRVGDYVLSRNQDGEYEYKKVINTFDNGTQLVRDYYLDDDTVITCTPGHRVMSDGAFTPIEACETVDAMNGPVKVWDSSEFREEHVYDIEVDTNHNFVSDGKLFHNCRSGAQTPFSSINYGTDTSPEGRMVVKAVLDETDAGLGEGETPIFPVQIFKCKKSVNGYGAPNHDLFKLACRVSAKRLFPNFTFLDSPYNAIYYKEGHPETEIAVMGCRTKTIANTFSPDDAVSPGRGNFSFCTINLPACALEAQGDINKFFVRFDELIDSCIKILKDRFEYIAKKRVFNFPFLMGQGVYINSDTLGEDDEIREVIKHSSLSVGFVGLAECLVALVGHHHGESTEAQTLGLKIVKHLRQRMDEESKKTGLNWSCFATPAEGLSSRAAKINAKRFGIIAGVTDRKYVTNSFHIPVYYNISAYKKMQIEAPYHELCNAGSISYVEVDGDVTKNPSALETLVNVASDLNMSYFSINHPVDRCPVCGFTGVINDVCPKCGRRDGEGVPVSKLIALGCSC